MSGRRIDDRSAWMGKGSDGSVLPLGAKMKKVDSAEGSGSLSHYEDTADTIKSQQEMNVKKAKSQPQKVGHRN